MWNALVILFSAITSSSPSASVGLDEGVAIALSRAHIVGEIESITSLGPENVTADFEISAQARDGRHTLFLSNPEGKELPKPNSRMRIFLLSNSPSDRAEVEKILWSPTIGIFDCESNNSICVDLDSERIKVRKESRTFLEESGDCPSKINGALERLDSSGQQQAIETLFRLRPLSRREFACVVQSIDSDSSLEVHSYSPPYWSQEGAVHHGFKRRGDLVMTLLPHLMKYSIYPNTFPADKAAKQSVIDAWGYWGSRNFGSSQEPQDQ